MTRVVQKLLKGTSSMVMVASRVSAGPSNSSSIAATREEMPSALSSSLSTVALFLEALSA